MPQLSTCIAQIGAAWGPSKGWEVARCSNFYSAEHQPEPLGAKKSSCRNWELLTEGILLFNEEGEHLFS